MESNGSVVFEMGLEMAFEFGRIQSGIVAVVVVVVVV